MELGKTATVLLIQLGSAAVKGAIAKGEYKYLKVPGLGSKTAQKIVLELRNIYQDSVDLFDLPDRQSFEDTFAALKELGFNASEIEAAISKIENGKDLSSSEFLRKTLTLLRKQ
jgi:Holliday junction resolvasome RuvABC DNA-binding subunit